jgi:hypothetical protein
MSEALDNHPATVSKRIMEGTSTHCIYMSFKSLKSTTNIVLGMPTCATLTDIHDLINTGMCVNAYSAVASSIIGGGLIYTRVLKSIVFMVWEHEYMNMGPPPPPNYRGCYGTGIFSDYTYLPCSCSNKIALDKYCFKI